MAEILWDRYDVPHIAAANAPDLFYAFGRCQMRNHGDLLLRLYGQARGRAAEYWGGQHKATDYFVRTMGIPERAGAWHEQQRPEFLECLTAFAAGLNDFAAEHAELVNPDLAVVLPVSAVDVLAHAQRVVNFGFVLNNAELVSEVRSRQSLGSNAWAIGPARSASGHAMLLVNPHLPWHDMFRLFEAHLSTPDMEAYGMTCVGLPVLTMAFNSRLGWGHTINRYRGWTLYELELADGGYRFDDAVRAFEIAESSLAVRQDDGELQREPLVVRNSVHGPVMAAKAGKAYAVRVTGLDRPRALEQWWNMARAQSLGDFDSALRDLQIPTLTVMYADADGHVMHLFNANVHARHPEDDPMWTHTVPGHSSSTLWGARHTYDDLPRLVDPPTGWVHNANDPPWTSTWPPVLRADDYPAYMAPRGPVALRAQQSAAMLIAHERLDFEQVVASRFSTRVTLADRLLDDLIAAAARTDDQLLQACARVLTQWDRCADERSQGAVLFAYWVYLVGVDGLFATPWDERAPLTTPHGLGDSSRALEALARAARKVETMHGSLDVPWGDVFRVDRDDVPATREVSSESLGIFAELWYTPTPDGRFAAVGGDSFSFIVEFSDPVRAEVLLLYGNSTQPHLAARSAQFDLYASKTMRPALRTRAEVEAACVEIERCRRWSHARTVSEPA